LEANRWSAEYEDIHIQLLYENDGRKGKLWCGVSLGMPGVIVKIVPGLQNPYVHYDVHKSQALDPFQRMPSPVPVFDNHHHPIFLDTITQIMFGESTIHQE
jgi:hypothetical protein